MTSIIVIIFLQNLLDTTLLLFEKIKRERSDKSRTTQNNIWYKMLFLKITNTLEKKGNVRVNTKWISHTKQKTRLLKKNVYTNFFINLLFVAFFLPTFVYKHVFTDLGFSVFQTRNKQHDNNCWAKNEIRGKIQACMHYRCSDMHSKRESSGRVVWNQKIPTSWLYMILM